MSNNTTPTKKITPLFPDIRDKPNTLDNQMKIEETNNENSNIIVEKKNNNLPVTQSNHRKCWNCNKRVGYTGFKCKCGYTFCGSHRYSNAHNCTYDHKKEELDKLRILNPQVIANKLDRI